MSKIDRIRIPSFESQKNKVMEAIESGELVYGNAINEFESQLKKIFNRSFVCLCNSGNSALLLALKALGITNKKVLVPAGGTCFAIENAVLSSDNTPVYCDLNLFDSNLDVDMARSLFLEEKYDAIITPNYFGIISNISELMDIGVPVIEDCSQSFLSNSEIISSSNIQIFSFYPTKVINAIDGGAILTDDKSIITKVMDIMYYQNQMSVDSVSRFNLKMNNINAAFGLGTLVHLNDIKKHYKNILKQYSLVIEEIDSVDYMHNNSKNILYKFILRFDSQDKQRRFINEMRKCKIESMEEIINVSDYKVLYRKTNKLSKTTCSIPLYYQLDSEEVSYIIYHLRKSLQKIIK